MKKFDMTTWDENFLKGSIQVFPSDKLNLGAKYVVMM